jgi:hypothetical protein
MSGSPEYLLDMVIERVECKQTMEDGEEGVDNDCERDLDDESYSDTDATLYDAQDGNYIYSTPHFNHATIVAVVQARRHGEQACLDDDQ